MLENDTIVTMMKEIIPRIMVNPRIRFGKPVIKGTRVPVDLIMAKIGGGMTTTEVASEYNLKKEEQTFLSNPELEADIKQARLDYKKGKTITFNEFKRRLAIIS